MNYIYGIGIALAVYFGLQILVRSIVFVVTGRVWRVSRQQWSLTMLAVLMIVAIHFLLPPSRNIHVSQELPVEQVVGKEGENPGHELMVSDLTKDLSIISASLFRKKIHPQLKRLEIWSLVHKDVLDYRVPSYGLWYLLNRVSGKIKYDGNTWDMVTADIRLSCRFELFSNGSAEVTKVCDLAVPATLVADVVNDGCEGDARCVVRERIRFPAMHIRLTKEEAVFDVKVPLQASLKEKVGYEINVGDDAESWVALPARVRMDRVQKLMGKDIPIRLKVSGEGVSLVNHFAHRAHFNGELQQAKYIKSVVKVHEGHIGKIENFMTLGYGFALGRTGSGQNNVIEDISFYNSMRRAVENSLLAVEGYEACPGVFGSLLIHGLVSYLGLDIEKYRSKSEHMAMMARQEHIGLRELYQLKGQSSCTERQVVLEMMASQVKQMLPEDQRQIHFEQLGVSGGQSAGLGLNEKVVASGELRSQVVK